jgi:hypothetical protein
MFTKLNLSDENEPKIDDLSISPVFNLEVIGSNQPYASMSKLFVRFYHYFTAKSCHFCLICEHAEFSTDFPRVDD